MPNNIKEIVSLIIAVLTCLSVLAFAGWHIHKFKDFWDVDNKMED